MPVEVLPAPGETTDRDDDLLSGKMLRDALPPIFYFIGFGLPLIFITAGTVLYFDRGERFGIIFLVVGLLALGFMAWQSRAMKRSGFTFDNHAQELRERAAPQRALLHYADIAGFSVRKHTYKTSDDGKIVTQTSHETLLQTKAGLLIPIETFYNQPSAALKVALCVGIFPSIVALPLMFLSLKRWQLSQEGNQISIQFRSAIGTRRSTEFPAAELTGAFFTTASHGVSDALVLWRGPLPPLAPSPQGDETFELDAESDAAIPISVAGVAFQDRLLLAHHLLRMLRP